MNRVPLVHGEITFEQDARPFTGATLYARLEDITVADIAAVVVAITSARNVTFDPKTNPIVAFAIAGPPPDARASYTVRVHIDLDGDGAVSIGDFISTQSYPVLTFGYPKSVSVRVHQVK